MPSLAKTAPLLFLALCALGGCGRSENFSQFPGFDRYRAEAARAAPPDAATRAMLRRHKPRLFVAADQPRPIDFYRDYIAAGELYDGRDDLISDQVDPALLNFHRDDPKAAFHHNPKRAPPRQVACGGAINAGLIKAAANSSPCRAVGYAGAVKREMTADGAVRRFTFLTYHFVFRRSGLPAGISRWQRFFADLFADADDWHQLDHYTAATIVLDENDAPFAVMLQQHNHMRTFFIGADPAFLRGAAAMIDVARGSNELYPHRADKTEWPAAAGLNGNTVGYLAGTESAPLFAAPDITEGETEVDYELAFLPPDDAFYVFQGYLGEPRLLPGREGPPGAMYNNLPTLKPPEVALAVFYWTTPDPEYAAIVRTLFDEENLSAQCFDACLAALLNRPAFAALRRRFADAFRKHHRAQTTAKSN